MSFLYQIAIYFYAFLIKLLAPFNTKAKKLIIGRKNIFRKISDSIYRHKAKKIIWFHCSSFGEYEQGKPVLDALQEKYPQHKILLTFFSSSGYENVVEIEKNLLVHYLPIDTKKNAKKFIKLCKPYIVVFVKYDYWFNYINELSKQNIPLFVVSAIFRSKQYFFKFYGKSFREKLKQIHTFFVQDKESEALLRKFDFKNVLISGDTRFDRVAMIANEKKTFPEIENFCLKSKVLLCGSTWFEDEKMIESLFKEKLCDFKFIFAPHEIKPEKIERLMKSAGVSCIRYSDLLKAKFTNADVLIIDSIGILKYIYKYCYIAFIGGGFGSGIHNTLEAAVFGKPILFGPNYHKFKEAKAMIARKAAFSVSKETEFKEIIFKLLNDEYFYQTAAKASQQYVQENIGATEMVVREIYSVCNT